MPSSERLRRRLVRELEQLGCLRSERVRDAFLTVPRELFIPEVAQREGLEAVYSDRAFPTKQDAVGWAISSSSQPAIMALMLEQLDLEPGQRILEVGAGTGYNAALLKTMVGDRGRVTSVDVESDLVRRARSALRKAGHRVRVVEADARTDRLPSGSFDRVIVTASSADVPRVWFDRLAHGGLLELPLRVRTSVVQPQVVVALRKEDEGFVSASLVPGGFMTLRGAEEGARDFPTISVTERVDGSRWAKAIQGDALRRLSPTARRRLMLLLTAQPRRRMVARVAGPVVGGLLLYMALASSAARLVSTDGLWATGIVDRQGHSLALLHGDGDIWWSDETRARAGVRAYGSSEAEDVLLDLVEQWRTSGRPAWSDLRVTVGYANRPRGHWRTERRGECVLSFDWSRA
jgi:methyltransferase of FxLD system